MNTALRVLTVTIALLAAIPLVALGLIFSQSPEAPAKDDDTLNFKSVLPPEQVTLPLLPYKAEDGSELGYRFIPAKSDNAPLVILIHGSGWHGGSYQWLARQIAGEGDIAVAIPDLRGHGPSPQMRGDVDYIGQMEDDVAALAKQLLKPGQKLILAGHSSGGGFVIRFAGGQYGGMLSGAVLLSPYLNYKAPTMRDNAGGWSQALVRRAIGLSILNGFGIHALDGLTVVTFHFPRAVLESAEGKAATTAYSWRLNVSYAPRRDYLGDVGKLPPFLLVAGKQDEAFRADQFEPTLSPVNPRGEYHVLDGVDHLGLINNQATADLVRAYVSRQIGR
ncbi:alpha/beta hydrolase [Rhizobium sp. C4]|uniref:alpha/beta hydrolase n=1 Tax=Rhizobium sp. C4 TaxID=1349800 RepID=UPI001E5843CB|nr:alpha/beta fold hydrolase [Rhizobium sp. C4]MCD2174524.1 alpha/beta fold hydrolase [Rhizobium sp. C4]